MSVVPLVASEFGPRIRDFFRIASVRNSFSVFLSMSLTSVGKIVLTFFSSTKKVCTSVRIFVFNSSSVRGLLSPIFVKSVM